MAEHRKEVHMERVRAFLRWWMQTEERRFITVGGTIAIVQNIILILFVINGFEKVQVNRYLQPTALFLSFFPHREITWKDKKGPIVIDAVMYYSFRIVIMVFNTWCFEYLISSTSVRYEIINPLLIIVEAFLNFLVGKFIIYRKTNEHAAP